MTKRNIYSNLEGAYRKSKIAWTSVLMLSLAYMVSFMDRTNPRSTCRAHETGFTDYRYSGDPVNRLCSCSSVCKIALLVSA